MQANEALSAKQYCLSQLAVMGLLVRFGVIVIIPNPEVSSVTRCSYMHLVFAPCTELLHLISKF